MSDNHPNTHQTALKLGQYLNDLKAKDVMVLDVKETCTWTDYFVLGTYNSQGHLKGLVQEMEDWAAEHYPEARQRPKKNQVNEWMLIDWDGIVIHLFSDSARAYYELEKLWFTAPVLYSSKSSY